MIPKVKQKVANWNQKGTKTEPNGDQNVKNKKGLETIDRPKMNKKCFWRHFVDLEVDLGAHWILKGSQNLSFLCKINKIQQTGYPGRRLEKT